MRRQGEDKHRQSKNDSIVKVILSNLFSLLKIFFVCIVLVYLTANFVVRPFRVSGDSMYPTIRSGEFGFGNAYGGHFLGVQRGDIVIAYEGGVEWIKRVIGVPGETIEGKEDTVYINGKPLKEPYVNNDFANNVRLTEPFMHDFKKVTLGEDEYFLMGDNRYISKDSREVGPFKRKQIKAIGFAIAIPINKMRVVK